MYCDIVNIYAMKEMQTLGFYKFPTGGAFG